MKRYAPDALQNRLVSMFPDIMKKGISISLNYDDGTKSWLVKLAKNDKEQMISLPEVDADTCMTGKICQPFKAELDDVVNRFEGR